MKKVSRAPYVMLALALIGIAVALYDAYAIYNGRLLWCPPPINGCNEVASNDGKLVGIVSRANLLHGIVAQQAGGNSSIDDRKIKAAVRANSALNLVVSSGVARIWGVVATREEQLAARVAAECVPGVKEVHANIQVLPFYMRTFMRAS